MKLFDLKNRKLYIICFIPRSGSNHLCSLLERSGIGIPGEYYFPYDFNERYHHWNNKLKAYFNGDIDPINYFECILKFQHSIAGIKVSWDAMQAMMHEVSDIVEYMNPKYIYITRDDKIMQAISWARALQTQVWSSDDLGRRSPQPIYDKAQIEKCLEYIEQQENRFENFLSDKNPLRIAYEELSDDTIREVSEFLDVPIVFKKQHILSKFRKLRDKVNDDWYQKFTST